jgi:hypothetical protein
VNSSISISLTIYQKVRACVQGLGTLAMLMGSQVTVLQLCMHARKGHR